MASTRFSAYGQDASAPFFHLQAAVGVAVSLGKPPTLRLATHPHRAVSPSTASRTFVNIECVKKRTAPKTLGHSEGCVRGRSSPFNQLVSGPSGERVNDRAARVTFSVATGTGGSASSGVVLRSWGLGSYTNSGGRSRQARQGFRQQRAGEEDIAWDCGFTQPWTKLRQAGSGSESSRSDDPDDSAQRRAAPSSSQRTSLRTTRRCR